jgi:cysteine desulfurase/selenocysteine lyase
MGFENVAEAPVPRSDGEQLTLADRYKHEFPVTEHLIYLNHAAVAPLCRRASEAMKRLADDACEYGSLHYTDWLAAYDGLRDSAARLLGADAGEVAIVKNTSEGIAMVAGGLSWRKGDRVVAFREEFPANYYPWLRLEARGVTLTWLSIYDDLETIERAVNGARLLAISFVNYLSGHRVELKSIGEICRRHGCFFFVDAIQGLGVLPLNVEECHIDGLAADGHKWMLGPEGNGIFYVRRERWDEIEPVEFGWTNSASFNDYSSRDMTLRDNAGRYECGTLNTVGCFGQRAALELLLEIGIDEIASTVLARAEQIAQGVRQRGYELMRPRTAETASGIVTFRHPRIEAGQIVAGLRKKRITAAPRQGWIRVSPHFYNDPGSIDEFLRALPEV